MATRSASWSRTSRPNVYATIVIRVPFTGGWREVLNTNSAHYGGSNVGNERRNADFERRGAGTAG